jgi:acetyl esterase/lipase
MSKLRVLIVAAAAACAAQEPRLEPNVVFGMYSGLALLMDVYHPAKPNGYGVIYVSGSGFHAPQSYGAEPLKESSQAKLYARRLAGAGYTVFSICHRAAPRFRYPAAVEDAQRAVRFVRFHAARFGIRADRVGAVGGSSGGHLVLMLGLLDGGGDPAAPDPADRASGKVQCVVARAAPSDLRLMTRQSEGGSATVSFLGMPPPSEKDGESVEQRTYREASPITHVSADDPPVLLMHGDADPVVPYQQSETVERALAKAGVPVKLLRVPGGGHGATFEGAKNPPDYLGEMVRWLDTYLQKR